METLDTSVDNVENPEVSEELDGGGLPSAKEDKTLELSKFSIDEEIQSKYFRDGKINGKYETIKDLIEGAKSYEDKYSQVMRDIKSGKYQEATQATDAPATSVDSTVELAQPLVQEFVANGMELTDELLAKAVDQGLDVRDVKLAAIEIKEKIQQAYSIVGGESEYKAMIEWGKANLSDKAKASFDKELSSGMGEFAIKGLYAEYKASNQSEQPKSRIMGDGTSTVGIRPYESQAEILKDKAYLNSQQGRYDTAAKALYEKRMSRTPDEVIFGRR